MQNPYLVVGSRGSNGSVSLGEPLLLFEVNPVVVRQDSCHDIYLPNRTSLEVSDLQTCSEVPKPRTGGPETVSVRRGTQGQVRTEDLTEKYSGVALCEGLCICPDGGEKYSQDPRGC